jgi:transcriptional regulator GlxA family with amidase domain
MLPAMSSVETRRIAVLTFPGGQVLDVTGPLEVFSIASRLLARRAPARAPAYAVEVLAATAGPLAMSSGVRLVAERACTRVGDELDTLLVAGGDPGLARALEDADLVGWLAGVASRLRRVGSVCTGAFLLARAGLLDGRRATTHWAAAERLARLHPAVEVDPDALFVQDGPVWTSAGVTAGMDLALALVEEDHGRALALEAARQMVLFLKRPGGQSQFSRELGLQTRAQGPFAELADWILTHLDEPLAVPRLARRVAMSPRNFARAFRRTLGVTPAKFVERARVERARASLERGEPLALDELAAACGFGSTERMRRTFQRHLRVVPHDYRRRFRRAQGREG